MLKTTLKNLKLGKSLFFILSLLVTFNSYAQTPIFNTPVLQSGTDKAIGAKYIYTNVTTVDGTAVDAIVTLVDIVNATIVDVDNANNGGGSLRNRFQPVISSTVRGGYVEFSFEFYKAGTFGTAQQLQINLNSFVMEVLDLDGGEFYDIIIPAGGSYALETPTSITVSDRAPFTRFQGSNISVDPISILNTSYIASVSFGSLSSVSFRLGSNFSLSQRQSSISFGEVVYNVPKAPVANNDSSLCRVYGTVSLDVTSNDTDPNQNINKATVDLNPSQALRQTTFTTAGQGTWTVTDSGIVTFTPLSTFKGDPTPISYTISDSTLLTSNTATITITYAPATPTATATLQPTCAVETGTITVTAPTGTGLTYSIDGSNYQNTSGVFTGVRAGTYSVTAKSITGCVSPATTVVINSQPASNLALSSSSKSDVSCFGTSTGSVTAGTVTGSFGTVTYSWKNASNTVVGTTATVSNLPAGTYTLTVTDSCSTKTNSVTVGQPTAALALANSTKTDASCFGTSTGSVAAGTVTGAVGTVTYSWKNESNTVVGTTATVSNLPAGTYTLTVTDSCSTKTNSVTVGQPTAALSLANSTKTDASCFGTSTGSVAAGTVTGAVGTVTYSWKNESNTVVGTTATVSNLPAGTYTLTVTDSCSTKTNSVTVGQPTAALALANSTKTDASCFGTSTGSV
ncbi:hypothetical protein H8R23_15525, partial [Flavobacterium sp. F-380]